MMELVKTEFAIGEVALAVRDGALCALVMGEKAASLPRRFAGAVQVAPDAPSVAEVVEKLRAYFAGDVHAVDSLRVDAAGTDFQRRVWAEVRRIPAGETRTYGEIGVALGAPAGVARAVGRANATNPVALVIPCHRVVGAGKALCGYAYGLERKRWLLEHERRALA